MSNDSETPPDLRTVCGMPLEDGARYWYLQGMLAQKELSDRYRAEAARSHDSESRMRVYLDRRLYAVHQLVDACTRLAACFMAEDGRFRLQRDCKPAYSQAVRDICVIIRKWQDD